MKRVLEVIAVIFVALAVSLIWAQKDAMKLEEDVLLKEAQVESVLQRRADLIPNLITVVKEYEEHEKEVFTAIADARINLVNSIASRDVSAMNTSNAELTDALTKLIAISEDYPELKSSQQFTALMDELAGTENRIAIARQYYNEAVSKYNRRVKTFPDNILLSLIGYKSINYFNATEEAKVVPVVDFN